RRRDQSVAAGRDRRPAAPLRLGRLGETLAEPGRHDRVEEAVHAGRIAEACYTIRRMWIALGLVALSVLIIVHEAGHYVVARWSRMRVERFSVGFGPALIKWRHAGTQFQIAPILFGGFVHITGMNPHEEYDDNDPNVYPNRPTILRFLTILAGPLTNMIFASVVMFGVYLFAGMDA